MCMENYIQIIATSVGLTALLVLAYVLRFIFAKLEKIWQINGDVADQAVLRALDRHRKRAATVQKQVDSANAVMPEVYTDMSPELKQALRDHDRMV